MGSSEQEKQLFISYSHEDRRIANQLKEDLKERGFKIWMDHNILPGEAFPEEIEENIRQSIAVLYLASPTSRSSGYVRHELEFAKIYKKNIIPLWIRGDTEWVKVVTFGCSSLVRIDLRGERYKVGIERLMQTLKDLSGCEADFTGYLEDDEESYMLDAGYVADDKHRVSFPTNQEENMPIDANEIDQRQRNPYKGLHAFEYRDARDFFGREKLVRDMVQHVKDLLREERKYSQAPRCMMVVGASGSGKSSVVMAGLLPALEDKTNIGDEVKRWFFLQPLRPGEYPMNALTQTLSLPFLNEANAGSSPFKRWNRADLRNTLNEPDSRGLITLLRKITNNPNDRIILIVDQFEEIFAPTVDLDQQKQFINLLIATATEPEMPILILFTLRADFYDRILDHNVLYKKVKRHLITIPPMTREELRTVIEKPVQHPDVNVTFESYLAEDLLLEVYKHPESLPLLQFTLEQLFERRDRRKRCLTRQSYNEIEGLQGAINKHAEDIYEFRLPTPQHQAEARKLLTEHFIYITESYEEPSRLESGEEITRRRVTKMDLHLDDLPVRRETIDAFVDARLLTASMPVRQSTDLESVSNTITYEISHEALINAWERLRRWIKEDRKDIYLIQSLRPTIKQWDEEKNPKKKKELLAEKFVLKQLKEYRQRKTLGPLHDTYLKASRARQRHLYVRNSTFASITSLVILALVVVLIFRNTIFPPPPDPTRVTNLASSGPGTFPYALQMVSNGGTITFDPNLTGKTIHLTHNSLDINKSVTIRGNGVEINSSNTGNYIAIEPGNSVIIDHMTFTNSYTLKHAMIENAGSLTINNSSIIGNKAYNDSGAIYNTGTLVLSNDTIAGNIVSSSGGAINNLFGNVSISNSRIYGNEAYGNGGGIYSQGGAITVSGSHIYDNKADDGAGGGIDMLNGSLSISDTRIDHNHSDEPDKGIGGGIAIVGSIAFITASIITANTANMKGGGIAVTDDTDNNSSSLVKLQDVIPTTNQSAIHYIGQNTVRNGPRTEADIAGNITNVGANLQILDDTSIDTVGDPPPPYSPEKSSNYLGLANINLFCLNHGGSYGQISQHGDPDAQDIMFTCLDQTNKAVGTDFSGQAICQSQYPTIGNVIDRMANYNVPTSLQCYKNLRVLGPLGQSGFASYCIRFQYKGLFNDPQHPRQTAYDWLCQPKDPGKLPRGLSVTSACNLQYNANHAIDRLVNFNTPDGWECLTY